MRPLFPPARGRAALLPAVRPRRLAGRDGADRRADHRLPGPGTNSPPRTSRPAARSWRAWPTTCVAPPGCSVRRAAHRSAPRSSAAAPAAPRFCWRRSRAGELPAMLEGGLAVVEAGDRLARGRLGDYAIDSDSGAATFLAALDDLPEPALAVLRSSPEAEALRPHGMEAVSLERVGRLLKPHRRGARRRRAEPSLGPRVGKHARDRGAPDGARHVGHRGARAAGARDVGGELARARLRRRPEPRAAGARAGVRGRDAVARLRRSHRPLRRAAAAWSAWQPCSPPSRLAASCAWRCWAAARGRCRRRGCC